MEVVASFTKRTVASYDVNWLLILLTTVLPSLASACRHIVKSNRSQDGECALVGTGVDICSAFNIW